MLLQYEDKNKTKMKRLILLAYLSICMSWLKYGSACSVSGVFDPNLPITAPVQDVFRGTFFERETQNIISIGSVTTTASTNYVSVTLQDSILRLTTTNNFENYEEVETNLDFGVTVDFNCVGGQPRRMIFEVFVIDTNNNDPIFLFNTGENKFEFTVTPPLPQNFDITGCLNEIIVRDIDLTTSRIDFDIVDGNDYFQINYAGRGGIKEFKAKLETKVFIRTLPEPVTLRISATDVDGTNDPPRTVFSTIEIHSNEPFMPADLIFSETYYVGTYGDGHEISLDKSISLIQGFDEEVNFILESDYNDYLELSTNGNTVSIQVKLQLPVDVIRDENQILFVIRAQRELVADTTATVIVQLPEETPLQFQEAFYEGTIENNLLSLPVLIFQQGYQGETITVTIENEYTAFFNYTLEGNAITITMSELDQNLIDTNSFLTLRVVASTGRSTAVTFVSLEIIKDDNITPVFEKTLYYGNYDPETGLNLEPIAIVQGFDSFVTVTLEDYNNWFNLIQNGSILTLEASEIPTEVFVEQKLLLTVRATKLRTVGATTVVSIDLPKARLLNFEAPSYRGSLRDDREFTHENILLNTGYADDVNFTLSGGYAQYFSIFNEQNQVYISLLNSLPDSDILDNSFLSITVNAVGLHSLPATATILIEIIKDDLSTPVFSRDIYYGSYLLSNDIEIEGISLRQGFDDNVTFSLQGENSDYFDFLQFGNNITLILKSEIPEEVILREKVMVFSIVAIKPLTVGGMAIINIKFPEELTNLAIMTFSQNTYVGVIEDNILSLETIILDSGFKENTFFELHGDFKQHFQLSAASNVANITLLENLEEGLFEEEPFIVLEVEASRSGAISVTTSVVVEIKHKQQIQPIFAEPYYIGVYNEDQLHLDKDIFLIQGYDNTVEFSLNNEALSWFNLVQNGESFSLTVKELPEDLLANNSYILLSVIASKPGFEPASTAVIIDLPKETVILNFAKKSYIGRIENSSLQLEDLFLDQEYNKELEFDILGDHRNYFEIVPVSLNSISIELGELPIDVIELNNVIVFDIIVYNPEAIPGHASVVIEIIKEHVPKTPVFERPYYIGDLNSENDLLFDNIIQLIQGHDENVIFTLSGDNSNWFNIRNIEANQVTLILNDDVTGPIEFGDLDAFIFSIVATKQGSISAESTIVINLPNYEESNVLGFEKVNYVGKVQNDSSVVLEPIVLSQGFTSNVTFLLFGDLSRFFKYDSDGPTVTIFVDTEVEEQFPVDVNTVVLELQATASGYVPALSTVILEVIREPLLNLLSFEELYYTGTYFENELNFEKDISLSSGYSDDVEFKLVGDQTYFGLTVIENSAQLVLIQPIPPAIISNNQPLIFGVSAESTNTHAAYAAIIITFLDEYEESHTLGFEKVNYVGKLQNNSSVVMEPIVLSQGFTSNVTFLLFGDLSRFFKYDSDGPTVTIFVDTEVEEQFPVDVNTVVLELQATASGYVPALSTVILEVIREPLLNLLSFEELYYTGTYFENELNFEKDISLSSGYSDDVEFKLVGDQAYFGLTIVENSAQLVLLQPIPPAIISNNQPLIFGVSAESPNTHAAHATIIITFLDEYEEINALGFEKVNYVGKLQNNSSVVMEPIVLSQGFTSNVTFLLFGDLSRFFKYDSDGPTVTIFVDTEVEEQFPVDVNTVVLELQATASGYVPALSTVILEVIREPLLNLLSFEELYYTGTYFENELNFEKDISLSSGYSDDVEFKLVGDQAYFGLTVVENSAQLVLIQPIPPAIISNNQPLIFGVSAESTNTLAAHAAIIITFLDEYEESNALGFEKVNYVGKLQNNSSVVMEPIVLSQGFTSNVTFLLFGDLSRFFKYDSDGPTVTIFVDTEVEEQFPVDVNTVVLELQATASGYVPALSTVILEVIREPLLNLLSFEELYYTGTYFENELNFEKDISLSSGYSDDVEFKLVGDQAYFGLTVVKNSAQLVLIQPIPPAIISNNQPLIFGVSAESTNTLAAHAAIIITFLDEYEESNALGFEKVNYVGKLQNNSSVVMEPIVLSQGFTSNVTFLLFGDLSRFFKYDSDGPTVTIFVDTEVGEQFPVDVNTVVLELQATASGYVPAHSTVILEVIREPLLNLLSFEELYYTGTYFENELNFEKDISLSSGYSDDVEFKLVGDQAYFGLTVIENSAQLVLLQPIPPAIISNNQPLIFGVSAESPNTHAAHATIIITFLDEYEEINALGFEKVNYVGKLQNNSSVVMEPIVLSQGFTSNVTFLLFGDLSRFFKYDSDGPTVTIFVDTEVEEQFPVDVNTVVLELQATASGYVPALSTVILEVIREPLLNLLSFEELYYTGTYFENELNFEKDISLSSGYSDDVEFKLVGDQTYFGLTVIENSAQLVLIQPIPPAIISNNQPLIFGVSAESPNTHAAHATIIITFLDEYEEINALGFEKINYVGKLQNDSSVVIEPIVLSLGFTSNVTFLLFGDLSRFFKYDSDGPTVTIFIDTEVEEQFPADVNTVVLELQATAFGYVPALSTVVLEVIREPLLNLLSFEELYYTGTYFENELNFEKDISLSSGYSDDVEFKIVGDQTYFGLTVIDNSAQLVLLQPIPPAIILNNKPLIFGVSAESPNSHVVHATIIITFLDEYEEISVLGFEKVNYVGKLQNDSSVVIEPIILSQGFTSNVTFLLFGELSRFFKYDSDGPTVTIFIDTEVEEQFPADVYTAVLELQATAFGYVPALSTVILEVIREPLLNLLSFEELYYTGSYFENELNFEKDISLSSGYSADVEFKLVGDQTYFGLTVNDNSAQLVLIQPIPPAIISNNQPLIFGVSAESPNTHAAHATIIITFLDEYEEINALGFEKINYVGKLQNDSSVVIEPIVLSLGFTSNVTFLLFGDLSCFFKYDSDGPTVTIFIDTEVEEHFPADVNTVVLELQATAFGYVPALSTVVLEVIREPLLNLLSFEELYYTGTYFENELNFEKDISLSSGYSDDVEFKLVGDQTYFGLTVIENSAQLVLIQPIPPAIILNNQPIIFGVSAESPNSHVVHATIIITFLDEYEEGNILGFEKINYVGKLENNSNVVMEPIILSRGFSESVRFELIGVMSEYFTVSQGSATLTITLRMTLPEDFVLNNNIIVLNLEAISSPSLPTYTTIILEIEENQTSEEILSFTEIHYVGSYSMTEELLFQNDIMLSQGYDESVNFAIDGDDSQWFHVRQEGNLAIIEVKESPLEELTNRKVLIFLIEARKEENIARATIIITLTSSDTNVQLSFEHVNYLGTIQDNVSKLDSIVLRTGYSEDVNFTLIGELYEKFYVTWQREVVSITLIESIPDQSIPANRILIFDLMASAPALNPAYTTVIFQIFLDENHLDISFDKIIYTGILGGGHLKHETITLVGYNGPIEILGHYGTLITASVSNNIVSITPSVDMPVPSDISSIILQLRASTAEAAVIVQVEHSGTPTLPTVTFSSEIYALSADVDHIGFLGRVAATASNLEALTYELILDTEHLQQRLSINNDGEISLSAAASVGTYMFQIQATTVISRVNGTAAAQLTVSAITVCDNDDKAVPPLIILDRDEESPHQSLVPLDTEKFPGCQYVLSSRWPFEQSWLYVDENGLHTTAIDREHPSIAFMALSQIQVELILQCNDDSNSRRRRSIETESRYDWLGPYDYGTNKWILTDTIHFDAKRSYVNLIVNDINDNSPVFVGKENEPLAVGYPVSSLEGTILPRSLVELEATDADIGENANIRYWSEESVLAVSPSTGFVHVRVGEQLQNDMRLIVQATDRFGEGNTGYIELLVKLVDSRHIVVVTVRDAFLDDEKTVLEDLSTSVGYKVNALRSVITSDETQSDEDVDQETRVKREASDIGSSLVMFIYGLMEREPVTVEQLTQNIIEVSSVVNIVRAVSLEDHLAADQICVISGRETALLVATIVLSVLLFMLIAATAFWVFLKWWRNRKYNEFTDESSLTSDKDFDAVLSKPEIPKPKLNIDELKRSERRLQEMLDAPTFNAVEPIAPNPMDTQDLVIEIPSTPISSIQTPIVIQSFDKLKTNDDSDDDEFGEIKKPNRRKSVVTFNENVEKIIHLEDDPGTDDPEIEIYKL